jgi:uncharacterized membrane protein YhhN
MSAVKSPWIIGFGVLAVVHLFLVGFDITPWDTVTKCLLAPLLAAWAAQLGGPRLLIAGLVFCFFGDLFMDLARINPANEIWFMLGMGSFALAHISFITLFLQRGSATALRASFAGKEPWRAALAVIYILLAIAGIAWAWSGFDPGIRPLVPIYAALLTGTAITSIALDTRAGVGAALFLVSDGLIAAGVAGRLDANAGWHQLAIMVLYLLSIFLITAGVLNREARTRRIAADGFDITQHTDCWPRLPAR